MRDLSLLTKALFWASAMLAPVQAIMWTMVFLIIVDFITGLTAAWKTKVPIQSKRMGSTLSKFLIYNLVILSAYFIELHVVKEVPWLKVVSGFIAVTELKSIAENFSKIYGINLWSHIKGLFDRSTPGR